MKTLLAGLLSLVFLSEAAVGNDATVHWKNIVGVITALNVDKATPSSRAKSDPSHHHARTRCS